MLREYRREDIDGMRAWIVDPDAACQMGCYYAGPQTWEQTEAALERILRGDAGGVHWVVADRTDFVYMGQCDLTRFDHVAASAELGIVLLSENRGHGIGREAIHLALGFAFGQLNLNRVYLKVYADNPRAIRCYERCGFQVEGRLRQDGYKDGEYCDKIVMGILREEYERGG